MGPSNGTGAQTAYKEAKSEVDAAVAEAKESPELLVVDL
jgi:hypothetical protein